MTRIISSRKRSVIALAVTLMALFLTAGGLAKTYIHLSGENAPEKSSRAALLLINSAISAPFTRRQTL